MKARELLLAAIHPRLPIEGELPSLGGATEWLNSEPLTAAGLRGKVVLISFWTCINGLRSLPYVPAWTEKYKDQGLVVIGVHSPEFAFERNVDNSARFRLNHSAFSGDWTIERQTTVLIEAGGRIAYCFHARDFHLVMGPAARGISVRFRAIIDGQIPGAAHG